MNIKDNKNAEAQGEKKFSIRDFDLNKGVEKAKAHFENLKNFETAKNHFENLKDVTKDKKQLFSYNFPELASFRKTKEEKIQAMKEEVSYKSAPNETIFSLLGDRAKRSPKKRLIAQKLGDNSWKYYSAADFKKIVDLLTKGLISKGLKKNDKVAIMAHTSFDWVLLDFALLSIGCVIVPIYETSSSEQIKYILNETNAKIAFFEDEKMYQKYADVEDDIKDIQQVFLLSYAAVKYLIDQHEGVSDQQLEKMRSVVKNTDVATIVFTSGSTDTPKGVVLQHKAFVEVAVNVRTTLPELVFDNRKRFLLFLPMSHVFARFLVYGIFATHGWVAVTGDIKNLLSDLKVIRPTSVLGVPRIFEKIYNSASYKISGPIQTIIFKHATKTAVRYSKMQYKDGKVTSPSVLIFHFIYNFLVYNKIRQAIGGNVKYSICGGAPLNTQIAHFFRGIGLTILEGFGLTETAAPVFVNRPTFNKIGTVGFPFPGTKVKVLDDGELLIKTPSLFLEYFKDKKATAEAIDKDGFFHTGDLGKIDEDGALTITGRKKTILITAGGKNVAPERLETVIEKSPLVNNAVLIGDKLPFISALITLDDNAVKKFLKKSPKVVAGDNVSSNPILRAELEKVIAEANKYVSRAESIRKFAILDSQFSIEDGTLTNSLKIKRMAILEKYADEIRALYKK